MKDLQKELDYFPIRCYACGKIIYPFFSEIGHTDEKLYSSFDKQKYLDNKNFFDAKGIFRFCCKRMLLSSLPLPDIER